MSLMMNLMMNLMTSLISNQFQIGHLLYRGGSCVMRSMGDNVKGDR